ncbi:unnamed protein product [Clonostachys byssicola]|uniref:CHAT domain-containing protein n=1 Tax=Clonostachys byssicola TaxID=160290 RepID=A0A9N9UAE6_9HYPO|nr:unnamed protein product [Clonostachys byssicola]
MESSNSPRQHKIFEGDLPAFLSRITLDSYGAYRRTGQIDHVDTAVISAQQAVANTANNDPNRAGRLSNLAIMLESRYQRTGVISDLREAVSAAQQSALITPDDHPDRAGRLSNLANYLEDYYKRTGMVDDLDGAVDAARQAVAATPVQHPNRAGRLNNLGMVLETRFERTKVMDDLEEAITVGRQAAAATSSNRLPHITCLNNLARRFYCLYTQTTALTDLEVAADLAKTAVAATPDGHPDRVGCLNHLGNILECWYKTTGSMKHLEEAIDASQQAVAVASGNGSDRIACLVNLGNKLVLRYEKNDAMHDLDEAIDMARQAVAVTCKDHPDYPSYLNSLASRLSRRFNRTGEVADSERAIRTARKLLKAVPQGHPDHAGWLSNLGIMLESRYRQLGTMDDLEEAIGVTRQAVANTPANHLFYASYLNNLSNKLERRYERTGEMNDLQEAIDLARRAIEAAAPDHPERAKYLDNLGDNLESLYEHTKEMSDLEAAIDASRQATVATAMPINHLDHLGRLNNLGSKLASRYDRTGVMEDLDEAIDLAQRAVAAIPKDHPDRPGYLNNRGHRLERRHEQTGSPDDLKEACDSFIEAWETPSAIPFHRIRSATHCIRLLVLQGKAKAAAKIGTGAIGLLPLVNTKLLNRTDQQYVVSTFAGIAANTCALLLAMGKVKDALLHLEQGRAVILGQLMDGRSDIAGWATKKPKLARRYEKLRNKVNSPIRTQEQGTAGDRARQERIQSISDLNDCITKIRKIPGYERFLRSQTTEQMKRCAREGSIVIINITELRSDAIIVSPAAIKRIHLPDLSAAEATTWLNTSWTGRRAERARKNKEYAIYLSWLWKTCVKVVLDALRALHEPTACEPFRVWWIGSGLASSMPFHAAGIHDPDSTETAYHQTISSYTPSIKALAHAQWKEQGCETSSDALLAVTMPTTPPAGGKTPPSLPGVNEEMENVIKLSKGHMPGEGMMQPSVDQVLSHLEGCSVAHFACHGTTDPVDPSNSGLILQRQGQVSTVDEQDGCRETARLIQDRLTVKMISEMDLKHAKLAYLSACSTAQNKVENLSDEVIHVVSGFHVAGFSHVVGCLWPSNDRVCVEVARLFYSSLFAQDRRKWNNGKVACALREALMVVRADDITMPLNWAQYVHYGI